MTVSFRLSRDTDFMVECTFPFPVSDSTFSLWMKAIENEYPKMCGPIHIYDMEYEYAVDENGHLYKI